jgi:hypothetical protein
MICTDLNSVLRGIFGAKRDGVTGGWKICMKRSFMICIKHDAMEDTAAWKYSSALS